jgi:trimeric autotransporter adhesin
MKSREIICTTILSVLVCFALSPVAQAKKPSEDRGNGNSAAENVDALNIATTGSDNTAHGWFSLFSNTTGLENTADGFQALYSNTEGRNSVAVGSHALFSNTIGGDNTAVGSRALFHNSETAELLDQGNSNSAFGADAASMNDSGSFNTAIGSGALAVCKGHVGDTAVGASALANVQKAVADLLAPDNNIALGFFAGSNLTKGAGNIYIGIGGLGGASEEFDKIRIGSDNGSSDRATFIAGIREVTTGIADAIPVVIDSAGQLGTPSSSQRFKNEIKPMDKASEAILAFKPVTFHYKSDKTSTPQFGLIAEEVAKVNPDLVVRDNNGDIYTVRYDAVNAMLLNEFLKEHRKNEEQEATIARQQKQIEALAAGLQKVSAQLEASKLAPQVVNNP